jgi:hypothetical protein
MNELLPSLDASSPSPNTFPRPRITELTAKESIQFIQLEMSSPK